MADKYDNATKQTWRGWAWNQIAQRVPPGSKVLCLAGDGGFDNAVALKKGLVPIGVDLSAQCVKTFRQNGGVAIQDKMHRAIITMQPDAVLLDECGDLHAMQVANWALATVSCKAVVGNWQRGRSESAAALWPGLIDIEVSTIGKDRRASPLHSPKHRGRLALLIYCMMAVRAHRGDRIAAIDADSGKHLFALSCNREELQQALDVLTPAMLPAFHSYRSKDGGAYFDSLAITLVNTACVQAASTPIMQRSKRKAAAAKALLTMRRNSN